MLFDINFHAPLVMYYVFTAHGVFTLCYLTYSVYSDKDVSPSGCGSRQVSLFMYMLKLGMAMFLLHDHNKSFSGKQ